MEPRSGCQSLFTLFLLLTLSSLVHSFTPSVSARDVDPDQNLFSPLDEGCPKACSDVGSDPSKWTEIHSWGELSGCPEQLLFGLNILNPPSEFATMQTCSKSASSTPTRREVSHVVEERATSETPSIGNNCGAETSTRKLPITYGASSILVNGNDAAAGAELLAEYVENGAACGTTILFAKSGSSVVGVYVGAEVQKSSAASLIRQASSGSQVFQVCNATDQTAQTVGVFAVGAIKDLPSSQKALQTWSNGKCLDIQGKKTTGSINLDVLVPPKSQKRDIELRSRFQGVDSLLAPRADCKAIQVVSGDSCASLAKKCGVTSANFNKYNPKSNFCSTLAVSQWVCCSAGTLPNKAPKPQADGTCAIYAIKAGDSCDTLARSYTLTADIIRGYNTNTYGWAGCFRLEIGQRICLSKGKTPMPKAVTGAVCGPQVPGTGKPLSAKNGWDVVGLNPCPLNACCSGFGFCGTTPDFCTNTTAKGGAPGTYAAGTAGCISNCGKTIQNNSKKPATFLSVGYFQAYNSERPCLNMDVTNLTKLSTSYTHMHFSFADLDSGFHVAFTPTVRAQFDKYMAMKAPWKKVVSFGGWAGSTDSATLQIYRDAMKSANREKFATNVMTFLTKYKVDGVDFDWEYPGAGSSPGSGDSSDDGANYLAFLTLMRQKIGTSGKTMSVALPAAYWSLKPFPVAKMAPLVDYIVYMTYDLHGQWDYGNQYASQGCSTGNCLRSHVNKTETHDALVMITKAGVSPLKVVVGISSYGRSFAMADPKCTGPTCKFTGSFSQSNAEPGVCTQFPGYLANAEITKILADAKAGKKGVTAKGWYDSASDSDILTYSTQGKGNVNWVGYMSDTTKKGRAAYIKSLNFAGTIDWAVDLQTWFSPQPTS
ncbi:glycoside hydrolase superfamily [Mariannaea sp. PMI_226]|nr:glycoside hydrolase superfamily [Mariannaea sp. PMI_226]